MGSSPSKNLGAPSRSATPVKVQDCPEECDEMIRVAKFALRTTDLGSWTTAITSGSSAGTTNSTIIKRLQHWSLVVHFPRGDKTYLFEAGKYEGTGLLQASRTDNVDIKVFEKAMYMYFGKFKTSPRELLEKARKVSSNGTPYNLTNNNCQTWLKEFLQLISPKLFNSFKAMLNGYTDKTVALTAGVSATLLSLAAVVLEILMMMKK